MKKDYRPKQIDLQKITLTNFQGQSLPLDSLLYSFSLYEDLFTNTMSVELKIIDAVALLEDFPITGEELLEIQFETPTTENNIRALFDVYKISERQKIEERTDAYTLYGVTREFISSTNRRIKKAYNKLRIDQIVRNVYNESLKSNNSIKDIFVEDTLGLHSYIAPKTNALDFINFLASEAQSKKYPDQSSFIFYEDHDQWNFRTITQLIDTPTVEDLYWAEFDVNEKGVQKQQDTPDESQRIIEIEFLNQFDFIKQADGGLFSNNLKVIDPILKKAEDFSFVYEKDFEKKMPITMGGNKVITPITSHAESDGEGHSRYFTGKLSQGQYSQTSYLKDRITEENDVFLFHPSLRQKFINSTTASFASLNNIGFELMIAGNSLFKPGQMINLYIPSNSMDEDNKTTYNKYFGDKDNAKFLVVRVEHTYNKASNEYFTKMKVVKDSYAEPIESTFDLDGN